MRATHLLLLCSLPGAPLWALEDAGPADAARADVELACGELTFQGECNGVWLRYCDHAGVVRVIDCSSLAGSCGLVDCEAEDCLGYACVAAAGESCADLYCDVQLGHGCLDGVCAASAACDRDSYQPSCDGVTLIFCPTGRVWDQDCSQRGTYPAECGVSTAGEHTCLRTEGAQCDPLQGIECTPTLSCSAGFCVRPPPRDGGSGEAGAAGDAGDGAGGGGGVWDCGCHAGARPGAAAALLGAALLGLRFARRRRARLPGATGFGLRGQASGAIRGRP